MHLPVVFLGPSLSANDARKFLEADYRPPIRRGDLAGIPAHRLVGIIDGVFDQSLAVSPREVRTALHRGVYILGSSSMGALRATEVPGMVGMGRIFEMFRSGLLEDDDEVAITFDPESQRALSEPMVNVRYAVQRLVGPGTISREAGDAIIEAAKALPYRDRTYPVILRAAGLGNRLDTAILQNMLSSYDLKREDAVTLLEEVSRRVAFADDVRGAARSEPFNATTQDETITQDGRTSTAPKTEDHSDPYTVGPHFSAEAPILLWEYGPGVPFSEVVRFLALSGELSHHARSAVARFALAGNELDLQISDGPSVGEVSRRIFDRLAAQWGFFTDEETKITLGDLGIGTEAFAERIDEEIETERRVMALVRAGSDEFLEALRLQLFLSDLSLKRATVRHASLMALADRRTEAPTLQDLAAATIEVCRRLDVRDARDAIRELSWWGYEARDFDAFVQQLARARGFARDHQLAKQEFAKRCVNGLDVLQARKKPAGEPRFSTPQKEALEQCERLRDVVGITRVAVITGLSDIGIPNVQAFRPDGHFSSTVGSGKSETVGGARIGAVMEEVEKWAQEHYSRSAHPENEVRASYQQLLATNRTAVDPSHLDLPYDSCYQPDLVVPWRPGHDLIAGQSLLVPAAALTMERLPQDIYFSQRAGCKQFGTNGLASGFNLEDATCHALCEYLERHADVLDEILTGSPGTQPRTEHRLVVVDTLPKSTHSLIQKIEASARQVRLYDIRADIDVPTFRARISTPADADEHLFGVSHQTAFGKACHPNPEVAMNMALLEAVQSVMTVTAGAREDLTVRSRSLGRHERSAAISRSAFAVRSGVAGAPGVAFDSVHGLSSDDAKEDVRWVVEQVRDAGYPHVVLFELTPTEILPARVVRVLVPGLETVNPFRTGVEARLGLVSDLLSVPGRRD